MIKLTLFTVAATMAMLMYLIWPAQSPCVQAATVNINSGVTNLNVRRSPVSGAVFTTLGTQSGLRVLATDPTTCWLKVNTTLGDGWITNSDKYVTIASAALPGPTLTPTATQTRTITPTPTKTATPAPSPTRVTGTQVPGVWVTWVDGSIFYCPFPCSFTISDKLPTRQP